MCMIWIFTMDICPRVWISNRMTGGSSPRGSQAKQDQQLLYFLVPAASPLPARASARASRAPTVVRLANALAAADRSWPATGRAPLALAAASPGQHQPAAVTLPQCTRCLSLLPHDIHQMSISRFVDRWQHSAQLLQPEPPPRCTLTSATRHQCSMQRTGRGLGPCINCECSSFSTFSQPSHGGGDHLGHGRLIARAPSRLRRVPSSELASLPVCLAWAPARSIHSLPGRQQTPGLHGETATLCCTNSAGGVRKVWRSAGPPA